MYTMKETLQLTIPFMKAGGFYKQWNKQASGLQIAVTSGTLATVEIGTNSCSPGWLLGYKKSIRLTPLYWLPFPMLNFGHVLQVRTDVAMVLFQFLLKQFHNMACSFIRASPDRFYGQLVTT